MALTKYKLGDFLLPYDYRNKDLSVTLFQGISTNKVFTNPKQVADDITSTKIVRNGQFAYNKATTRNGEKISIAYRDGEDCAVSAAYQVFYIKKNAPLLPKYLLMYFNRPEFDRYVRCNSWGSAHEFFTFEEMCDVVIALPDIPTQQKYVDIYSAMVANQQSYERGLEDLKLVCDGYIEDLRKKVSPESIGKYLTQKNDRNVDKSNEYVVGLSTKKQFREAQSRVNRDELGNYKIVKPDEIAFVPTTDTWKVLAFAQNTFGRDVVVSPIYEVFSVNKSVLLPEYLSMWLSRKEFDRYARFNSWGSARENFSYEDMCDVKIPIPDMKIQKAITDIYKVYIGRKTVYEHLKAQIKDICPILIRGSLEDAGNGEIAKL